MTPQSPPRLPLWHKAKAALKAAQIAFSGYGGSPWGYGLSGTSSIDRWYYGLPGTGVDWQALAGDLWESSTASICLLWIMRNIVEPTLVVQTRKGAEWEDDPEHLLCQLVNEPNAYYDSDNLLGATSISYCTNGNGYWVKARGKRSGRLGELLFIPHWQIRPVYPTDGSEFISHYAYRVDGRAPQMIPVEDVIHFRFGLDLYNYRLGWAPLGPQLRQVATDNEASTYEAALLSNMGIAPVMLSAGDPKGINEENRKLLEDKINSKFTGDGRGRWLVVGVPMKADQLGISPEHMALDRIRRVPEQRICAALGLNTLAVNLGDQPGGFDNGGQHEQARRAAYQDCIIPIGKTWAKTLTKQLGPDFGLQPNQRVWFDYSKVEALADDMDAVSERVTTEFQRGARTLNETRKAIHLEEVDGGDVFFIAKGGELVKEEELATHAEATTAPKPTLPPFLPESGGDAQSLPGGQPALPAGNGNGALPAKAYAGGAPVGFRREEVALKGWVTINGNHVFIDGGGEGEGGGPGGVQERLKARGVTVQLGARGAAGPEVVPSAAQAHEAMTHYEAALDVMESAGIQPGTPLTNFTTGKEERFASELKIINDPHGDFEGLAVGVRGVIYNPGSGFTDETFASVERDWKDPEGRFPSYVFTSPKEILVHELAHNLHNALPAKDQRAWEQAFKEAEGRPKGLVSSYAFENSLEGFAETVAANLLGKPATEESKPLRAVAARLIEQFKSNAAKAPP